MSVAIGKASAFPIFLRTMHSPLVTTRRLHERYGPLFQLEYVTSTRAKPKHLTAAANADLFRAVLSDPEHWRNIKINFDGLKNHASRRLTNGITRLVDARHDHYRRLLLPALKRPVVEAMATGMAAIAESEVAAWPRGEPVDLAPLTRRLAQRLAASLLFGDDIERAAPIGRLLTYVIDASWFIPRPAYLKWLATAPRLERLILEWAEEKRGERNPRDLLSVLVNSTDENGEATTPEMIVGLTAFLFGAAYDTCQNGLAWTLILLTQFPEIARGLAEEIDALWSAGELDAARINEMPRLDGVIKETLRLFPPIPFMFRKARQDVDLGDAHVTKNALVLMSGHLINRDPILYKEPDRFQPERWVGLKPSPFQYTVYGAGGHMCPGATFGTQMLKVAVAAVLRRSSLELPARARVGYRTTITLAPRGRVQLVFRERRAPVTYRRAVGGMNDLSNCPIAAGRQTGGRRPA